MDTSVDLFSVQTHDRFDVPRTREHIDRRDGTDLIAKLTEQSTIAGEGLGIAGDLNNAGDAAGVAKICNQLGGASLAWRVEDDDVGIDLAVITLGGIKELFGVGGITAGEDRHCAPTAGCAYGCRSFSYVQMRLA